ncbi:hypothetical protein BJV77DRAFT_1011748 [Russula vinacea]|nr:hypothetical protein BJV77DRAFT_1011748 [Russula vinacea]
MQLFCCRPRCCTVLMLYCTVGAFNAHCQLFPHILCIDMQSHDPQDFRARILASLLLFARKPHTAILQAPSFRCILLEPEVR